MNIEQEGENQNFQPFGHEQMKFKKVFSEILDETVVSARLTDTQKEVLRLRFGEDKSYKEISEEVNLSTDRVSEIRDRGIKGILYFSRLCGIENIFVEKNLMEKLNEGHKKILESLEKFKELGFLTEKEVEITKYYSDIINGLGNGRNYLNDISGFSDKNSMRKGDDLFEIKTILRKTRRLFFAKHWQLRKSLSSKK